LSGTIKVPKKVILGGDSCLPPWEKQIYRIRKVKAGGGRRVGKVFGFPGFVGGGADPSKATPKCATRPQLAKNDPPKKVDSEYVRKKEKEGEEKGKT